jgi:hypothetical protein
MSTRPGYSRVIPFVTEEIQASRGLQSAKVKSAATINATVLKAAPGAIFDIVLMNHDTTPHFLKLYDKASAPDPSADAALLKGTFRIGGTTAAEGTPAIHFKYGLQFETGIAYAITAAVTETDETATAADDITGLITFV